MIKKLENYKNKNNEYGKCIFNNQLCFYKIKDNILKEVEGYNQLKKYYKVPNLIYYDNNIILYEYKEELTNNTIHEYLYFDKKINLNNILKPYINSFKERVIIDEENSINKVFFKGRINKINYKPLNNIISNMKKVLISPKKLTCFLTQGDPTDTNISCNGLYTDFENAGYNSVIGEIAIMFASFITHGKYYYPKYNPSAYNIRKDILKEYSKYKPNLKTMNIPKKNINLMISFLDIFKEDKTIQKEIKKYLKYYIIMRMLSPIYINKMDKNDQKVLCIYINRIYNTDFNIESLYKLIKEDYNESILSTKT